MRRHHRPGTHHHPVLATVALAILLFALIALLMPGRAHALAVSGDAGGGRYAVAVADPARATEDADHGLRPRCPGAEACVSRRWTSAA